MTGRQVTISNIPPNKTKYFIIGTLAIGTATFLGVKIIKIIRWYKALKINISGKIHNYRNGNIILKCTVNIDNPKNFKITINKPSIRISSNNKIIAKSSQSKEKITIQPNSTTTINYDIEIPALSGELYKLMLTAGVSIANYIKQLSEGTASGLSLGIDLTLKGYTALKKAILQKKIRANSIFAKEIKEMEKRLVKFIDFVKQQKADQVKISIDDYERFKEIGNSEKVIKAVTYIIRYMGLINKQNTDNKAKNLLNHINKALEKREIDKNYMDTIKFIKTNLSKFDSNKKLLEIPQTTLQGLEGLNELSGLEGLGLLSSILHGLANPEPEIVSALELVRMKFEDIELELNLKMF